MLYYILFFIVIIILATFAYAGLKGAPWVPTFKKDLSRFIKVADIKPGQTFYDLGCGDGRLLQVAAQQGAKAVGFEISVLPYVLAKIRCFNNKNIKIKYKNFFKTDLSEADVIYFFLMPEHYEKIKKQFKKQCRPGTRVIAYVWPFKDWEPEIIDKVKKQPALYVYKV